MCNCVTYRQEDRGYYNWDGEWVEEIEMVAYSDTRDLDIHRYQCNQCGEIGYYSGRARQFYEEGIRTPGIDGLE